MHFLRAKPSRVLVAVALLTIIALTTFIFLPHEPSYRGKSFSFWLNQLPCTLVRSDGGFSVAMPVSYRTAGEVQADAARVEEMARQAKDAVDAIGTNGLRTLVSRLRSTDSALKLKVQPWATYLGLLKPGIPSGERRRAQALTALLRLRGRARPIVPELVNLTKSDDFALRQCAFEALSAIDPEYERE